jgi:hypothetical protein
MAIAVRRSVILIAMEKPTAVHKPSAMQPHRTVPRIENIQGNLQVKSA